jgi:hypothetical protein
MVGHAFGVHGQAGVEQYYYVQKSEPLILVPIVHVETSRNWYVEARYNYEELQSGSIYVGKKFSKDFGSFYTSVTPVIGGIAGKFMGGSTGMNLQMEFGNFFFFSQSQFTFTPKSRGNNFIFSWSELAIEPVSWVFFGASVQYTNDLRSGKKMVEEGVVVGFNFRKWTFPFYGFNLGDEHPYFILGVNLGIGKQKEID